jgi:hypothetical protein
MTAFVACAQRMSLAPVVMISSSRVWDFRACYVLPGAKSNLRMAESKISMLPMRVRYKIAVSLREVDAIL